MKLFCFIFMLCVGCLSSYSQLYGEFSLPHTTSMEILKQYIGQTVNVPSNYSDNTYDQRRFESYYGGYVDKNYTIDKIKIDSKHIKLYLISDDSYKLTAKINITKSQDFKNMSSCESFFLVDKFHEYVRNCRKKENNHFFYNENGDTVAVVTNVSVKQPEKYGKKHLPQITYIIKSLLHDGLYNTFQCKLEEAEEYCKNLGVPIYNKNNEIVAKAVGCHIIESYFGDKCEYQFKNLSDNSEFTASMEKAKNLCFRIGEVLTHTKVKTTYIIESISPINKELGYKVVNQTTKKHKTYSTSQLNNDIIFKDDLSGKYVSILTKVEKPSNSSIRYGKTQTIEGGDNITRYSYIDNVIDILIVGDSEQFSFILKNISNNSIKVVWNEAAFIDFNGSSSKIMHIGTKYSQRDADQPPTTIIKGAKIEDIAAPTSNVRYSSYLEKWVSDSMYPSEPNLSPGQLKLMLPIQIKDIVNEYIFVFDVKYVYNHPELLNF